MIKLTRVPQNPILLPTSHSWENMLVFNPGVILKDGKIYMLYRAMGTREQISRLGLAISSDGIHFERFQNPIYYATGDKSETLGVEDPRIVKIDDTYYITYIAVSRYIENSAGIGWDVKIAKKPQIALITTKDFKNFESHHVILNDVIGKDATFFPKKINGEFAILYRVGVGTTFYSHSNDIMNWPKRYPVFDRRLGAWDCFRVGVGAPPIETEKGWLLFYHGIDDNRIYRIGVMFLDLDDPTKILYRSNDSVFEPEEEYEKKGFMSNVVFSCGAIEKDERYFVYYGAADGIIGLATIEKASVLSLF